MNRLKRIIAIHEIHLLCWKLSHNHLQTCATFSTFEIISSHCYYFYDQFIKLKTNEFNLFEGKK